MLLLSSKSLLRFATIITCLAATCLIVLGFTLATARPALAASGSVTVCAPSAKTNWTTYSTGANDPCSHKLYARTVPSGGAAATADYTFNGLSTSAYHIWIFVGDTYANAGNVHYHVDAKNFAHGGYINQEPYTNQWVELSDYGTLAYTPNNGTIHVSVDNGDTNAANKNCASGGGVCYVSADAINVSTGGPPTTSNLNDYPWNGLTYQNGADGWGMGYGQCVSYTAWKIYQNYGGAQHPPTIPDKGWMPSDYTRSPVNYYWGNANQWANSARNAGIPVDHTPRVGDVAEWETYAGFAVGHVAYVYQVNGDGSIELSQYNLRENSQFSTLHMPRGGTYDTSFGDPKFWVPWPDNFIHAGD